MKIVVTGALGHIGSRLIRFLPDAFSQVEVVMVDNLSTDRYGSLFNLPQQGRYQLTECDILEADLRFIIKGADVVVHLAAMTNAPESFKNEKQVYRVNLEGTKLIAEACADENCPLIFPSTTSVYGTQFEVVDENCSETELKPQSPYAESKLRAEKMLDQLGKERGLRFIVCRFGTIFGVSPGMRFHTAINKFCWQAVLGQPITVWKTALNQKRPYLDLMDAMKSIEWIIQKQLYDRRVYNVLTINAAVQNILDAISKYIPDLSIQYVDAAIMNQLSYTVGCDRFKSTGFEFTGDLDRGIQETLKLLAGLKRSTP
jgi:UDP-glucose 4-epimerase